MVAPTTNRTAAPQAPPSFLASGRGKATLALLCALGFLDFVDGSIVNIALPSIRTDLHFSNQSLQWVLSGYLLTYGGFMLLGGRAADLLGRRRVLIAGTVLFGLASMSAGLAQNSGLMVASRLVQGLAAAMMLPATLSTLTTMFVEGRDRNTALGAWGGVGGLASAVGVFLGGVLTEGPGWRWVFFVNPPICAALVILVLRFIPNQAPAARGRSFDLLGAALATTGMLTLVYTLVKAPDVGWSAARSIGGLGAAAALLILFLANEARRAEPLVPLSIFRIRGLAAANVTQLTMVAGMLAVFFFLTLYMQNVLGYTPLQTGAAYLPLCAGAAVAAGVTSQLLPRVGTRPFAVIGSLVGAAGIFWLSRIPTDGHYVRDILPGTLVMSLGLGSVFVAVATAANAGVPERQAGLAAALLNSSQQVGGALGISIFSAIATTRTKDLLGAGHPVPDALTGGFSRTLLVSSIFLLAAAAIAVRIKQTRQAAAPV